MKKNSLTIKTLISFCVFSIVILISLWVIQIQLLSYSYEKYQLNIIENVADKISTDSITKSDLEDYAYNNNICVQIYSTEKVINYNIKNPGCILNSRNSVITEYKNKLVQSGEKYYILKTPSSNIKSIIYYINVGESNYVFINSTLEDIGAASNFLKSQLIYIIIILIILSILMAVFISKLINKPILRIINSAKELEKGNYNVKFENSGIAELDELSGVLTVAASEMNKTDELKKDLIANVSHDLKTPLTMIKAYAEKIKDISYKDRDKMNKDLDVIINETNRLNVLVNDLLDLSKLENNVTELNIEKYDLAIEINSIIKSYDIIKETENYNFIVNVPDKVIINADKSKINQVIYNLINNAIEHTGDDLTIKIDVKKKKEYIEVSITDSGKGLTDEEKKLVWNKYYTKEKNHKRNIVGSGIGLSIVKHVLETHNYEYGINSKVGKYTTFYFKIKSVDK